MEVFPTYEENFRLYRALAAQQAGRLAFGTYSVSTPGLWSVLPSFIRDGAHREIEPPPDLASYFSLFPQSEQLEALFLLVESKRIATHLSEAYHGLRDDLSWAAAQTQLLPVVLTDVLPRLPNTLWRNLGKEATVYDSLQLATELHTWIIAPELQRLVAQRSTSQRAMGMGEQGEAMSPDGSEGGGENSDSPLSPEHQEMLRKILDVVREHGNKSKGSRRGKTTTVITFDPEAEETGEEGAPTQKKKAKERRLQTAAGLSYLYDEWDFLIEDYRTQWCQVREIPVVGDNGAFFSHALATYGDLVEEIKREFQRLRPRLYRQVKGLEDGELIDLDAAITARVDRRSGVAPSTKLYVARQPIERDVAALFLLDLSASTETQLAEREDGARVIDIMKEALTLLSTSLETIGDKYAILGFSSRGRRDVEIYPVKMFTESLSSDVRGRIGGLAPQKSTRMGAAVRHSIRRLRELSSRAKFLVLLSDGHPEDADYGPSGQTPTYGVRDTMMALREAEQNGILSFCLTVDKAGKDYLREMCAPSRYMIIEDPTSLPTELPKIYQRHIRMQRD